MTKISFESFLVELGTREDEKFNSCHSANSGQFCSTSSGGSSFVPGDADALNAHYALDKNCPPIDCKALEDYTGGGYNSLNKYLRHGEFPPYEKTPGVVIDLQNNLDNSFKNAPLVPENLVAYRAINKDVVKDLKPGDTFRDKGFISTSISPKIVSYLDEGDLGLEIRVPKGTKGIYVEKVSRFKGEKELLLNRGTKFRVIENSGNKAIIEVVQ